MGNLFAGKTGSSETVANSSEKTTPVAYFSPELDSGRSKILHPESDRLYNAYHCSIHLQLLIMSIFKCILYNCKTALEETVCTIRMYPCHIPLSEDKMCIACFYANPSIYMRQTRIELLFDSSKNEYVWAMKCNGGVFFYINNMLTYAVLNALANTSKVALDECRQILEGRGSLVLKTFINCIDQATRALHDFNKTQRYLENGTVQLRDWDESSIFLMLAVFSTPTEWKRNGDEFTQTVTVCGESVTVLLDETSLIAFSERTGCSSEYDGYFRDMVVEYISRFQSLTFEPDHPAEVDLELA
jgi:hypothetical protein